MNKLAFILITALTIGACKEKKPPSIQTTAHNIPWFDATSELQAGAILVPEDHDNPDGKSIQITYVISEAQNDSIKKHPIIYFSGGPGGNSIVKEGLDGIKNHPLNQDHDIIFFDQRGTGFSSALPDMSFESFDILAMDLDEEEELDATVDLINDYKQKCLEAGIKLEDYNTFQNARDVGMLFRHLGYGKYNLLGGSYGTRLGRVVQDMFPGFIHSVTHNSPAPMSGDFLLNRLNNYSTALDRILMFCASSDSCNSIYPDLRSEYFEAVEALKQRPLAITTSDTSVFVINIQDGLYLLRRMLYQTDSREKAPALIRAFRDRKGELIDEVIKIEYIMTGQLNLSMLMSVEKYEQFDPNNTNSVIAESYSNYELIPARMGFFDAFYRAGMSWHEANLPVEQRLFQDSAIPTIIFVNQYDPVTPPAYGHLFLDNLSNGQLFVLDEGGHGGGNAECRTKVMLEFMANPTRKLDRSCLNLYED